MDKVTYWHNGLIKEKYQTNDKGELHGIFETYSSSGNIYSSFTFVNGMKHGLCKMFWSNGVVRLCGMYVDGAEEGEFITRSFSNDVFSIHNSHKGKLHGLYTGFGKNGEVIFKRYYVLGTYINLDDLGMDIDNLSEDEISLIRIAEGL